MQDGQVLAGIASRDDEVALETRGQDPGETSTSDGDGPGCGSWQHLGAGRATASMNMALWEDRSTPHSIAPPSEPRNHTEIPERIRCVDPNDPPRAPKSRFVGTSDRSWRVM